MKISESFYTGPNFLYGQRLHWSAGIGIGFIHILQIIPGKDFWIIAEADDFKSANFSLSYFPGDLPPKEWVFHFRQFLHCISISFVS
jgi:hypothetical protein